MRTHVFIVVRVESDAPMFFCSLLVAGSFEVACLSRSRRNYCCAAVLLWFGLVFLCLSGQAMSDSFALNGRGLKQTPERYGTGFRRKTRNTINSRKLSHHKEGLKKERRLSSSHMLAGITNAGVFVLHMLVFTVSQIMGMIVAGLSWQPR